LLIQLPPSHHLFYLLQNSRLYLAPLERNQVKHVLDIGTGTGIWAIDFAEEFPDATVIGTDLNPIQPNMVPPNCGFIIEDCEEGDWDYGPEYFDYIHIRTLFGCIKDWPALYAKAFR
jgi:trans-aconitate methyltransferase